VKSEAVSFSGGSMIKYVILLMFLILSCQENEKTTLEPIEDNNISLKVFVYEEKDNKVVYISDIIVFLDSIECLTNENGLAQFDSLQSGKYLLKIQNSEYIMVDTLINLVTSTEIQVKLLSIANDISWIATQGLNGRNIQMISHPDGFIFAGAAGKLYKLESGDSIWAFTGVEDIEPPFFITSKGTFLTNNKRSTDNGQSWSDITIEGISCFVETTDKIFVGGYGGDWSSMNFAFSIDDGMHWTKRNIGQWYPYEYVTNIMANKDDEVFISVYLRGLYKYINGTSFELVSELFYTYSSIIDDNGYIYTGFSSVYRSIDGGYTWEKMTDELGYQGYISLAINSKGHIFVGKYEIGVLRSIDQGLTWEEVNLGLNNRNIFKLSVDSKDYLYASVGGYGVIYRTKLSTVRN